MELSTHNGVLHSTSNSKLSLLQREIALAADEAAREYLKRTPESERTPSSIWDSMNNASDKFVKSIHTKDFDKYLAVANPKNGDEFFREVCFFSDSLMFLSHTSSRIKTFMVITSLLSFTL